MNFSDFRMIGLQIGTLIAQVVIIGDLGPAIISKWTGLPVSDDQCSSYYIYFDFIVISFLRTFYIQQLL